MGTMRRVVLVLVPLALVPASLGARSMSELASKPEAVAIPEEGSSEVKGLRMRATFEGKLGPTIQVRLVGYNPTAAEITASVKVDVMETTPGDPDSRMGSMPETRGSQTVAVEISPKGALDRVLTFKVKGMTAKRAARLLKRGLLFVDLSEDGQS